jgi:RimJ/RimL family protein N-acetyltransferase
LISPPETLSSNSRSLRYDNSNHIPDGTLGSEAIALALGYAFNVLELHRVSVRVVDYNFRAIRAYQKCGFVIEGREREAALVDGDWHDDVMMAILDREYLAIQRKGI